MDTPKPSTEPTPTLAKAQDPLAEDREMETVFVDTPMPSTELPDSTLPITSVLAVQDEKFLRDLIQLVDFSSDENDLIDEIDKDDSEYIPSESDLEESSDDENISSSTSVKDFTKEESSEDDMNIISSTTNYGTDKDLVENSDSELSDEIPYLSPLGPLCNPQVHENVFLF